MSNKMLHYLMLIVWGLLVNVVWAEDGYRLWLRFAPLGPQAVSRLAPYGSHIVCIRHPSATRPPAHDLKYYQSLRFPNAPG